MKLTDKFKQYLKRKTKLQRTIAKSRYYSLCYEYWIVLLFVTRLSYIVIVGNVAGTSLAEKTKSLYQGSEVVKAKRGTIYDRNGSQSQKMQLLILFMLFCQNPTLVGKEFIC